MRVRPGEVISAGRRGRGRARAPHTWSRHPAWTLPIRRPPPRKAPLLRATVAASAAAFRPDRKHGARLGEATRPFG